MIQQYELIFQGKPILANVVCFRQIGTKFSAKMGHVWLLMGMILSHKDHKSHENVPFMPHCEILQIV